MWLLLFEQRVWFSRHSFSLPCICRRLSSDETSPLIDRAMALRADRSSTLV